MRYILALAGLFFIVSSHAQTDRSYQELDYNNPQDLHIAEVNVTGTETVSYTHLTLPTIYSV